MLTIQDFLRLKSDVLDTSRVKLVRHQDNRPEYRDLIKSREGLLQYQRDQSKEAYEGCDYIVSFAGRESSRAIFIGVFKVKGVTDKNGRFLYDLEPVADFEEFMDRIVIDWGNNARSWCQWYERNPKEIFEILPAGYIGSFPGLLEFVLDFEELRRLIANPDANRDWRDKLSAVNGIYLILDETTGRQYIGSAYGKDGIWQRWATYAHNGTGGNKELKDLLAKDPGYYRHFRFSVLQSLPSNVTAQDIVVIEALYKQKLGSRAHGLNHN